MKKVAVIILFFIVASAGRAQEMPVYSQYMLNPYLINPAIAGIEKVGILQLMTRQQWVGINGAPKTYIVSYHQGQGKVGLGGYIYDYRNGNSSDLGFHLTYAYHIRFLKKNGSPHCTPQSLSFGLSLSGSQQTMDESKFGQINGDPLITGTAQNTSFINGDVGIYYTYNDFFTGMSCANIFPITNGIFTVQRNYFFQIGKSFFQKKGFVLEPSLTNKFNQQGDMQFDMNIKCILPFNNGNNAFWAALSFRNNIGYAIKDGASFMPIVGINTSHLRFAYAFEIGFNTFRQYGSHELMALINLADFKETPSCPAYKTYRRSPNY